MLIDVLKTLNDMADVLSVNNKTIATAESCSGGYIAHLITSQSGSSAYYKGSVVSYSNEVKMSVLRVKSETISCYGAVSKQTAEEMAMGVVDVLGVDFGVAVTGVAGPNGGTEDKPVGTVWMAVAKRGGQIESERFVFHGDRLQNIESTAKEALRMLYSFVVKNV